MQKKGTNNINDVIYKGMKFKGLLRLKFIRLLFSGDPLSLKFVV